MTPDEVARRLVHASGTVVPAAYLAGTVTWPQLRFVYLGGVALAAVLEFFRLVVGLEWSIYRRLTREYEQSNPAGYALYVFSSAAVVWTFEPRIAVPSVLMLTIADPVSGLLSTNDFGEVKRPLVLGVTFLVCGVIAVPFVSLLPAVAGALAATAADGLTPVVAGYVIDDNASIPPAAAVAMWVGTRAVPA